MLAGQAGRAGRLRLSRRCRRDAPPRPISRANAQVSGATVFAMPSLFGAVPIDRRGTLGTPVSHGPTCRIGAATSRSRPPDDLIVARRLHDGRGGARLRARRISHRRRLDPHRPWRAARSCWRLHHPSSAGCSATRGGRDLSLGADAVLGPLPPIIGGTSPIRIRNGAAGRAPTAPAGVGHREGSRLASATWSRVIAERPKLAPFLDGCARMWRRNRDRGRRVCIKGKTNEARERGGKRSRPCVR